MSKAVTVNEKETADRKKEKGNGLPASGVRLPSFLA
jgi:hypothetical protein